MAQRIMTLQILTQNQDPQEQADISLI